MSSVQSTDQRLVTQTSTVAVQDRNMRYTVESPRADQGVIFKNIFNWVKYVYFNHMCWQGEVMATNPTAAEDASTIGLNDLRGNRMHGSPLDSYHVSGAPNSVKSLTEFWNFYISKKKSTSKWFGYHFTQIFRTFRNKKQLLTYRRVHKIFQDYHNRQPLQLSKQCVQKRPNHHKPMKR